jgi:hypothetical protein
MLSAGKQEPEKGIAPQPRNFFCRSYADCSSNPIGIKRENYGTPERVNLSLQAGSSSAFSSFFPP